MSWQLENISPTRPLRVTLIEDNDIDAAYLGAVLERCPVGVVELERHYTTGDAATRLEEVPADVVLTDLSLPDAEGLESVRKACRAAGSAPVVVMTSCEDPELAIAALEEGAQDYLVKGSYNEQMLTRSIRYSVARAHAEAVLKEAAEALRRSNRDLEEYASIASHDLRAPIRTARLLLDRLDDALPPSSAIAPPSSVIASTPAWEGSSRWCRACSTTPS